MKGIKFRILTINVLILFMFATWIGGSTFVFSQDSNLTVSYLDVGQADSIVLQLPNQKNILIDGGNRGDAKDIISFLKKHRIKKIDAVIATHPHEDHIGGLPQIIDTFEVGQVVMPKVASNTKIFEFLLLTIKKHKLSLHSPKAGQFIVDEKNLKLQILSRNDVKYDEINDWSIVLKLTYGDRTFLFTGDAGVEAEKNLLHGDINVKADVLKVGHHGSRTSTSQIFLDQVNPSVAIISCGKGNDYGHPHKETLKKLKGIKLYRTDLLGTITVTTNGKTLSVMSEK